MPDLTSLTAEDYASVLGNSFEVLDDPLAPVLIHLAEVVVHGERPGYRPPFSLRFRGPVAPLLEPVTHRVRHVTLGEGDVFFGPIAADPEGTTYEAVFG